MSARTLPESVVAATIAAIDAEYNDEHGLPDYDEMTESIALYQRLYWVEQEKADEMLAKHYAWYRIRERDRGPDGDD